MKLSTKTLSSLLLATMASVNRITRPPVRQRESRFERLLHHHDRKGELRAAVLELTPLEFKRLQKKMTTQELVRSRGFKGVRDFHLAILGKLRAELLHRGWSRQRIDHYVVDRSGRIN
jgi:hypothetical protein